MSDTLDYETIMLALTLWREARGESFDAKVCVAATVMNRVRLAGWQGDNVVDVVTKKWQYSSMSDPRDRQLTTWPSTKDPTFVECLQIATAVITKVLGHNPVIDHYYDDSLKGDLIPAWAKQNPDKFMFKIGRLNFYNLGTDPTKVRTA